MIIGTAGLGFGFISTQLRLSRVWAVVKISAKAPKVLALCGNRISSNAPVPQRSENGHPPVWIMHSILWDNNFYRRNRNTVRGPWGPRSGQGR